MVFEAKKLPLHENKKNFGLWWNYYCAMAVEILLSIFDLNYIFINKFSQILQSYKFTQPFTYLTNPNKTNNGFLHFYILN